MTDKEFARRAVEGRAVMPLPSPADLVERNGAAAQSQTDKQPVELLNGQGTPSQQQDRGHQPGPNRRPKV